MTTNTNPTKNLIDAVRDAVSDAIDAGMSPEQANEAVHTAIAPVSQHFYVRSPRQNMAASVDSTPSNPIPTRNHARLGVFTKAEAVDIARAMNTARNVRGGDWSIFPLD